MRNEYPRPELVRSNWLNLNGEWDFEFDFGNSGITIWDFYIESNKLFRFEEMQKKQFSKKINVPFCPESKLSGIEYKDFINIITPLELENIKRLESEINHFINKFDHNYKDAPWGTAKDALPRGIEKISSQKLEE